jgi:hypothetical protein
LAALRPEPRESEFSAPLVRSSSATLPTMPYWNGRSGGKWNVWPGRVAYKTRQGNSRENIEELSCFHNFVVYKKKTHELTTRLQFFAGTFGQLR